MRQEVRKKTVTSILEAYPVGSIYISTVNKNPSNYFGGTWASFGTGRCLVGVNTSDSNFNTVEKTGGASTHTLTAAQLPALSGTAGFSGSNIVFSSEAGGFW